MKITEGGSARIATQRYSNTDRMPAGLADSEFFFFFCASDNHIAGVTMKGVRSGVRLMNSNGTPGGGRLSVTFKSSSLIEHRSKELS